MENLKMTDALLSRFDLVFLLLDKPDEMQDQLISGHILGKHGGKSLLPTCTVDIQDVEVPPGK